MSTATETLTYKAIRDHLGTVLTAGELARLFQEHLPQTGVDHSAPYAIMRLIDNGGSGGTENPFRSDRAIEINVYGRPASQLTAVRAYGDKIKAALRNFVHSSDGLIRTTGYSREPFPPGTDDTDAGVIGERHLAPFYMYEPAS